MITAGLIPQTSLPGVAWLVAVSMNTSVLVLLLSLAISCILGREAARIADVSLSIRKAQLLAAITPEVRAAVLYNILLSSQRSANDNGSSNLLCQYEVEKKRVSKEHMLVVRNYLQTPEAGTLLHSDILLMAAGSGHWQALRILLDTLDGWSEMAVLEAFSAACQRGMVRCMRILMERVDPSVLTVPAGALCLAVQSMNPAAVHLLLRDGRVSVEFDSLLYAVAQSSPKILQSLLGKCSFDAVSEWKWAVILENAFTAMHASTLAVVLRLPFLKVSAASNALFIQCAERHRRDLALRLVLHPHFDPTLDGYALLGALAERKAPLMFAGLVLAHPLVDLQTIPEYGYSPLDLLVQLLKTPVHSLGDVEDLVHIDTIVNRAACLGDLKLVNTLIDQIDAGLRLPAQCRWTLVLASAHRHHCMVASLLMTMPISIVSCKFADTLIRRARIEGDTKALNLYWTQLMQPYQNHRSSALATLIKLARMMEAGDGIKSPRHLPVFLEYWERMMNSHIEALPKPNRSVKRLFRQAILHYTFTISASHALGAHLVPDISDYLLQLVWTN